MRLAVYWFGSGLLMWLVLVLPIVWVVAAWAGPQHQTEVSLFAFAFGMVVGGFTPIIGLRFRSVRNLVGL